MVSVDYLYSETPGTRNFSVGADPRTQNMRNFKHLELLLRVRSRGY